MKPSDSLTKEQIRQRLRVSQVWIGTQTNLLPDAVPESKFRYIIDVVFNGDVSAAQNVQLEKGEEGGTFTGKWLNLRVAQNGLTRLSNNYDIENPVLTLNGGSHLAGTTVGNSLPATATFWDDEI